MEVSRYKVFGVMQDPLVSTVFACFLGLGFRGDT